MYGVYRYRVEIYWFRWGRVVAIWRYMRGIVVACSGDILSLVTVGDMHLVMAMVFFNAFIVFCH